MAGDPMIADLALALLVVACAGWAVAAGRMIARLLTDERDSLDD